MTVEAPDLAAVRAALRIDDDMADATAAQLTRHVAAGTERANRQAPDAPEATAHEAIIRFAAHLYEGPVAEEVSQAGIWRRCGAEGLLAPWTVRRGGVIGAD